MAASAKSVQKAKEGILQAMADLYSVGVTTASLKSVSATAGYKGIEGKAFRTAVKELKEDGIITRNKDDITITQKGIEEEMPEAVSTPDNASMQAKLLELILKEPKGLPNEEKTTMIFNKLCDGKSRTKKELATLAGYANHDSKTFRNLTTRMTKTLALLEAAGAGRVQLVDRAFPMGRPDGDDDDDDEVDSSSSRKRKPQSDNSSTSKGKRKLSVMCTVDSKYRR